MIYLLIGKKMANREIDQFIDKFPTEVKDRLLKIRDLVKKLVPEAEEAMGYGVPSFKFNGKPLIYYAAFAKHIGIYPVPEAEGELLAKIKKYQTGKGTMQFLHNEPMPYDFIEKIIKLRVEQL